ncbi:hypothetical protein H4219_005346 [Mycoemilia scoparia]|uniref:RRM domain-containing protein n=1 Tax=Mycoemilia scoparia TaxID=417184 RepID=A0A9W8DPH4_9FUNG|nr:hypothetical protein H4219_005346 [Mycoemilia scoparia]
MDHVKSKLASYDADTAETLSDFILTLLCEDRKDEELHDFLHKNLLEFLEDNTEKILGPLVPGLIRGDFYPERTHDGSSMGDSSQNRQESFDEHSSREESGDRYSNSHVRNRGRSRSRSPGSGGGRYNNHRDRSCSPNRWGGSDRRRSNEQDRSGDEGWGNEDNNSDIRNRLGPRSNYQRGRNQSTDERSNEFGQGGGNNYNRNPNHRGGPGFQPRNPMGNGGFRGGFRPQGMMGNTGRPMPNMFNMAPMIPGGGPGFRPFIPNQFRPGMRPSNMPPGNFPVNPNNAEPAIQMEESKTELVITKIPSENLNKASIGDFFSSFGPIKAIRVFENNSKGLVQFESEEDAKTAYNSPEPIFGNRFVQIHWRKIPANQSLSSITPTGSEFSPNSPAGGMSPPPYQKFNNGSHHAGRGGGRGGYRPFNPAGESHPQQPWMHQQQSYRPRPFNPHYRPRPQNTFYNNTMQQEAESKKRQEQQQQLVEKLKNYIAEQRDVVAKLEDPSATEEMQKLLMEMAKKLDTLITDTKEQIEKLKAEEEATTTTAAAAANSLSPTSGANRITPTFRPTYYNNFRGRGRGRGGAFGGGPAFSHSAMKLDKRPRTIKVTNVPPAILPIAKEEFGKFGIVTNIEVNDDGNWVMAQYAERWQAEEAMKKANSNIEGLNDPLAIEWVNNNELPESWSIKRFGSEKGEEGSIDEDGTPLDHHHHHGDEESSSGMNVDQ